MKVLHLVHDSPYTDGLVKTFEYFNVPSRFVVLSEGHITLKMVSRIDVVEVIDVSSTEYQSLLSADNFDVVWLHYAARLKIDFVNRLPDGVKVFWGTWGGDYYQFLGLPIYGWRTLNFLASQQSVVGYVKYWVRFILKYLSFGIGHDDFFWSPKTRLFFKHISFFSAILPNEEGLVRRIIGTKPKYVTFHTETPQVKGSPQQKKYCKADLNSKRIWAGNSAISTNNHFDMYAELAKPRYGAYEVYSPLSYGSEGYHNQIAAYGKRMMGERYHPILNYMPWNEYAELMSSCSIFVFWHYRQQSVGNIMMALRMGGCVFISRRSPVYEYLKGRGLIIYSLEDLKSRLDECLTEFKPLQEANRDKAMKTYNWEEMAREMKASLEFIAKEVSSKK